MGGVVDGGVLGFGSVVGFLVRVGVLGVGDDDAHVVDFMSFVWVQIGMGIILLLFDCALVYF